MSRVLLTHADLDGVGCDIILNKMFGFDRRLRGGYTSATRNIRTGKLSGYESCFVTDMAIEKDLFDILHNEYGDKLVFIDHHQSSEYALRNKAPHVIYNPKAAATKVLFDHFMNHLHPDDDMFKFVYAVDGYDMWRIKEDPEKFSLGYKLNVLFWEYGYNTFFARFSEKTNLNFTEHENNIITAHKNERNQALKESDINPIENNAVVIVDPPIKFINDYTIFYPDFDVYYIIYMDSRAEEVRLSVRNTLTNINIGSIIKQQIPLFPYVVGGGGHSSAGGVDFGEGVSMDGIYNVIESINNTIKEAK